MSFKHNDRHFDARACSPSAPKTLFLDGGLSVAVAAGADAVGENTFASADIAVRLVDRGLISFAYGVIGASAAANGSPESGSFASAYAAIDIMGADILGSSSVTGIRKDGAGETYLAEFFALDLKWLDFDCHLESARQRCDEPAQSLNGNLATFSVSAEAYGDDTSVSVVADAIAVEDLYSSALASATMGVHGSCQFDVYSAGRKNQVIATGDDDSLVNGGKENDRIATGTGDDWIFAGKGKDKIETAGGDDTIFAGESADRIAAGDGDDWAFGGDGDDNIDAGLGDDLVLGGDGKDVIRGRSGDDVICAGRGNDAVFGDDGSDTFRLGLVRGDGDDVYCGGGGADLYVVSGEFDRDVIKDFRVAEGDRIGAAGDWETLSSLVALNGSAFTLARSRSDGDDLVISFESGRDSSVLILDEFFVLNPGYGSAPRRGTFSDADAVRILSDVFESSGPDGDLSPLQLLTLADQLDFLA